MGQNPQDKFVLIRKNVRIRTTSIKVCVVFEVRERGETRKFAVEFEPISRMQLEGSPIQPCDRQKLDKHFIFLGRMVK